MAELRKIEEGLPTVELAGDGFRHRGQTDPSW